MLLNSSIHPLKRLKDDFILFLGVDVVMYLDRNYIKEERASVRRAIEGGVMFSTYLSLTTWERYKGGIF